MPNTEDEILLDVITPNHFAEPSTPQVEEVNLGFHFNFFSKFRKDFIVTFL